ncbi:hypothetical protein BKA65DRAFT_534990 [Rhexocercosporidium sp. MPI-PUGE-AT-0058]|nr:hypothetical protein BKA65DRAFT_534990 [Rhexocercosporidium sp. MPI-PUGE-AT-0058]
MSSFGFKSIPTYTDYLEAKSAEHIQSLLPLPDEFKAFRDLTTASLKSESSLPPLITRYIYRYIHSHELYQISTSNFKVFSELVSLLISISGLPKTDAATRDIFNRCKSVIETAAQAWTNQGLLVVDGEILRKSTVFKRIWDTEVQAGGTGTVKRKQDGGVKDGQNLTKHTFVIVAAEEVKDRRQKKRVHFARPESSTNRIRIDSYLPEDRRRLTLTTQGVLFLAASGYSFPFISKETILDRSKADGLAKTVVCLQAGYMLVQCTTRVACQLSLSLLEINTLGHVIFAQRQRYQMQVSGRHVPTCSWKALSEAWDGSSREASMLDIQPRQAGLADHQAIPNKAGIVFVTDHPGLPVTIKSGQKLAGTGIGPKPMGPRRVKKAFLPGGRLQRVTVVEQHSEIQLDAIGVRRWRLHTEFTKSWDSYLLASQNMIQGFRASDLGLELVVDEVPNWPHGAGHLSKSIYATWAAIALAVGLYGGLHLSAWNEHFPSPAEQFIWRTSASLVAASGTLALLLICVDRLPFMGRESYIRYWWKPVRKSDVGSFATSFEWHTFEVVVVGFIVLGFIVLGFIVLGFIVLGFIVLGFIVLGFIVLGLAAPLVVGLLAYIPARIFLVVEAFASLRNLPVEVYQTPDWTQLIPHL